MRVLIASDARLDADVVCTTARDAKKVIKEQRVSALFLSQNIRGRERGIDVLKWAEAKGLLPKQIMLIDANPSVVMELAKFLRAKGYRAFDSRKYMRIIH